MNFQTGVQHLSGETKKLKTNWKTLSEHWQDSKFAEFKKEYIDKLDREINSSLKAFEEINELFREVQEECF